MSTRPAVLSDLAEKVAPEHTALILIDWVNDFMDPEGKTAVEAGRPIEFARSVIPTAQRLLASAREAGVLVAHVQHTTLPEYASSSGPWLDARSRATYSVEDICLDGSWGHRIIDELEPAPGEPVVKKYRYSGFAGTNLDLLLRSANRRSIVVAGVSTNACVEATAREGFSLDYYVVYAGDACASWNMELHDATLASAAHRYATVTDTPTLVDTWRAGHPS